jgi:hypothetical protein
MSFDDGSRVSRIRSDKRNIYKVRRPDGNTILLKAMGAKVPEEVSTLIAMPAINWQGQLDSPFLLSLSAGDVSRLLNEEAGLTKIDEALSRNAATQRGLNASVKAHQSELASIRTTLSLPRFEQLEERRGALNCLEQGVREFEGLKTRQDALCATLQRLNDAQTGVSAYTELESSVELVRVVSELHVKIKEQVYRFNTLKALMSEATLSTETLSQATPDQADIDALLSDMKAISRMETKCKALLRLVNWGKDALHQLRVHETMEIDIQKKLPKQCPTCGRRN